MQCQRSHWLCGHSVHHHNVEYMDIVLVLSLTTRKMCRHSDWSLDALCRRGRWLCGHDNDSAYTSSKIKGFSLILKELNKVLLWFYVPNSNNLNIWIVGYLRLKLLVLVLVLSISTDGGLRAVSTNPQLLSKVVHWQEPVMSLLTG